MSTQLPLNQRIDRTKLEKHSSGDGWLVPMRNGDKAWILSFSGNGSKPIIGDEFNYYQDGKYSRKNNYNDLMLDAYVDPYAELKAAHKAGKVIQCLPPIGEWMDMAYSEFYAPVNCYRVKPEWTLGRSVNGFTLQEGQEWRWPEIWTEENLAGCRPLIVGELEQFGDQFSSLCPPFTEWTTITSGGLEINPENYERPRRTRRPLPPVKKMVLTFNQITEGWIEWNGGECPVAANSKPKYMLRDGSVDNDANAGFLCWHHRGTNSDIVAYLPEVKKMVKLGPEDVPPGSAIRYIGENYWQIVLGVCPNAFYLERNNVTRPVSWEDAQEECEISRDGGKTWQKCEKEETK